MVTRAEPSVVELGVGDAARWVAAGSAPRSPEAVQRSTARFAQLMAQPLIKAAVAGWGPGRLGRVMIRLDESQITLWAPTFCDGMDAQNQVQVAGALAAWAVGIAQDTGRDRVETKPADDTECLDVWLRALDLAGSC
jgi:hypothetical protein